jgi:hypothetical protein
MAHNLVVSWDRITAECINSAWGIYQVGWGEDASDEEDPNDRDEEFRPTVPQLDPIDLLYTMVPRFSSANIQNFSSVAINLSRRNAATEVQNSRCWSPARHGFIGSMIVRFASQCDNSFREAKQDNFANPTRFRLRPPGDFAATQPF